MSDESNDNDTNGNEIEFQGQKAIPPTSVRDRKNMTWVSAKQLRRMWGIISMQIMIILVLISLVIVK